jgi:hypothetical protein
MKCSEPIRASSKASRDLHVHPGHPRIRVARKRADNDDKQRSDLNHPQLRACRTQFFEAP